MHGMDYASQNVDGWIAQEKLDGLRALWTGKELVSREGKRFNAPAWFLEGLPSIPLDGELYAGPGTLSTLSTRLARWKSGKDADWMGVAFRIFDLPSVNGGYPWRVSVALDTKFASTVPYRRVSGIKEAIQMRDAIQACGGEGVVLRHPSAPYIAGRTDTLLKLK